MWVWLGNNYLSCADCICVERRESTNRTRTCNQDDISTSDTNTIYAVSSNRCWFNECTGLIRERIWKLCNLVLLEYCNFTKSAGWGRETGASKLLTEVTATGTTWNTATANNRRHDCHTIANFYIADIFSNFNNSSREFVAENLWIGYTGEWVWLSRGNDCSDNVFMKIGATDSAEEWLDYNFIGKRSCGDWNIFNANIFLSVKTCCLHYFLRLDERVVV